MNNILRTACGFLLINSIAHASIYCPNLTVNAICENGVWSNINISPLTMPWEMMGENLTGKACSSADVINEVRWNYAFSSSKVGAVGCNYNVFNTALTKIGLVQIKSSQLIRTGSNWEKETYPGNWSCHQSQEMCLFSERK